MFQKLEGPAHIFPRKDSSFIAPIACFNISWPGIWDHNTDGHPTQLAGNTFSCPVPNYPLSRPLPWQPIVRRSCLQVMTHTLKPPWLAWVDMSLLYNPPTPQLLLLLPADSWVPHKKRKTQGVQYYLSLKMTTIWNNLVEVISLWSTFSAITVTSWIHNIPPPWCFP